VEECVTRVWGGVGGANKERNSVERVQPGGGGCHKGGKKSGALTRQLGGVGGNLFLTPSRIGGGAWRPPAELYI